MHRAINSAILGVLVALVISLLEVFLLVNGQVWVAKQFILHDTRVVQCFLRYSDLYIYLLFVDNALNSLLAVLKSFQKHQLETIFHYLFFYAIGIPTSLFLAHSNEDAVTGIWMGYLIANSLFVAALLVYLITCLHWHREIASIQSIFNQERAIYV